MASAFADRIKQFDAYPKTLSDFRVKTFSGAMVTAISSFIMILLFVAEFHYYLSTEVDAELFVDTTRQQKLRINIDIFFPRLGCAYLSIDAIDVSGEQQKDLEHNLFKRRFDEKGRPLDTNITKGDLGDKSKEVMKVLNDTASEEEGEKEKCGSCYGAERPDMPCCATCDDIKHAYKRRGWALPPLEGFTQCQKEHWSGTLKEQSVEGCQLYGYIEVSKVAGKFKLAPGRSFQENHVHIQFVTIGKDGRISMSFQDLDDGSRKSLNISHHIRSISFGEPIPGVSNPLDGAQVNAESNMVMYQYFLKIVPTVYRKASGDPVWSNQYSYTKHERRVQHGHMGDDQHAGVYFVYELSPMLIQYTERRRSFMHFMTGVCAIIGGIFTVAGLIDSMIYHSAKAIKKKIDLGKAT